MKQRRASIGQSQWSASGSQVKWYSLETSPWNNLLEQVYFQSMGQILLEVKMSFQAQIRGKIKRGCKTKALLWLTLSNHTISINASLKMWRPLKSTLSSQIIHQSWPNIKCPGERVKLNQTLNLSLGTRLQHKTLRSVTKRSCHGSQRTCRFTCLKPWKTSIDS